MASYASSRLKLDPLWGLSSCRVFACKVSTRKKDFLIDPFDIFEQLHMLNEAPDPKNSASPCCCRVALQVFSDPRIVKVLHGADRRVLGSWWTCAY